MKKLCLVFSLILVFLFTGLVGGPGPGIVFADEPEPDWSQVIANLNDLRDRLDNLSPEQVEDAVALLEKMIKMLYGQDGNQPVLSPGEQTCLENKLGIGYTLALAPVNSFKDYVNSNTSGSLTGYEGFVNALQTSNLVYLLPLCSTLYNALGTPVKNKLEEHEITIDELVGLIADLSEVKFTPGLELTPAVSQQIADILQDLIDQSNLTDNDLICCGLTTGNFGELLNQLSSEEKASLEDILDTMGNIEQGTMPQATTNPPPNATGVALNAAVSAVFDQDVTAVNLTGVTIKDAANNPVANVLATLATDQHTLNIAHDNFAYNTTYTVTIPAESVKSVVYDTYNEEITWGFQTLAAPPVGDYILTVGTDKPSYNQGETVNVTGTLKQNNEEQTLVKNVSVGLLLQKDAQTVALAQKITDASGSFTWQITSASLAAGSYTVLATANVVSAETTFEITAAGVVAPTVQTNDATGITTSSATLNGNITNTGGENCDQRKFQYRKQGTTEWTDAGVETGSFGTGAFSFSLTGLTSNTAYEVKAMAHNSAGWGEGSVATFTTSTSGGGRGGGYVAKLEVDTYEPAENAEKVALDAVVKVTFKQDIGEKNLTKVSIKDDQNKAVTGVKATVSGRALTITHDKFSYETKYTVSVPAGTVKRANSNIENDSLSWSFTTLKELPPPCVFTDVPENHWAVNVIKELCQKGIIGGYPDGTFKPGNDITRAEFTKIIVKALGLAEGEPTLPTFKDVAPGDWYFGVVEAAAKAGLVKGYENGEFRPNAKITREEIAAILVRALGKQDAAAANAEEKTAFQDDQSIASWARGSVVVAAKEGLIKGYPDGTFGPKKNATRAETCAMVSRFLAMK